MHDLTGRNAIVTGGARGIGRAVAEKLMVVGARAALLDADEKQLRETTAAFKTAGYNALGVVCDIADEVSVRRAMQQVKASFGSITILVNNAGIIQFKTLEHTTLEEWDRVLAVNLRGAFICCKMVIPDMKAAHWGRIVNVGSSAGKTGGSVPVGAYGISKAGIMCLAKSLASELAPFGVTVNAVAPAAIDTDMISGMAGLVSRVPLGRLGRPEDVANAIAFLCSEEASFITGEVLDINGGFLID